MKNSFTSKMDTFCFTSDFTLTREDVRVLKNIFLRKRDLKKDKIRAYQRAIHKFKRDFNDFKDILQKSGDKFSRLPLKIIDKKQEEQLNFKITSLKKHLKQLKQKKELRKMVTFTSMSHSEKIEEIKETQRTLKKVQSELENGLKKDKKEIETYNNKILSSFVEEEWPIYEQFFKAHTIFYEILFEMVESFLEEELELQIGDYSKYSLKKDLLTLVLHTQRFIMKLKEKAAQFKNELSEKINEWKVDYLPFSGIFHKSGMKIHTDGSNITVSINPKKVYKNIFKALSRRYGKRFHLKKPINFDKEAYLTTLFYRTGFMMGIVSLLKNSNSKIEEDFTRYIKYKKINGKACFRIEFKDLTDSLFYDWKEQRKRSRERESESDYTPEKFREEHHYIQRLRKKIKKSQNFRKIHPKISIPLVVVIIFVIFSFFFFNSPKIPVVGRYDSVKIDFIAWESDEDENYDVLDPLIDITVWVLMVPITENASTGLVLGLYNNLLDKQQYFNSELVWLNKCIDQNRDGIDDNTGQPALTYGNSTDQYFNTYLMIQFKILDIQKPSQQPSVINPNPWIIFLIIFLGIGIIVIFIVGPLIIAISFGGKYREKKRLSPITVPDNRKIKLMKYGFLILFLLGVSGISLAIINAVTPFSHLYFLSKFNPFVYPVLSILFVLINLVFIPVYLVLFRSIHEYVQKKRSNS
ncbi:hypothetical protein LCGC14_0517780 [marine sediment metagenome]|uniref:Uncharacterized protein n=1 Tax=marine sediment metagenome TaxID=412755 RepID=A0A0F9UKX8_9ZZZZ|nr:hypothetical protein [bacterium]